MLLTRPPIHPVATTRASTHPFLIVRREDYADLQARAGRSPWREMKAAALEHAATVRYHAGARIDVRAIVLAQILSSTALAYVLDPDQRPRYVARVVEHLRPFDPLEPGSITAEMIAHPDKTSWRHAVPTGNAFFQGVLALDIVRNDLPAARLAEIETFLRDGPARYFRDTPLAWGQGTLAAATIFALYEGDAATYEPIVADWKPHTLEAISPDGVFNGGPEYADARWNFADRENKALFGEVLQHVGILADWFDEPRLGMFQEWLNGYARTPFRVLWTFGDSAPDRFNPCYQPGPERAHRYSALAGRYAAWLGEGQTPLATLGTYVLTESPPAEPAAAPSRVFADGGAWLKQAIDDPMSLAGVLWNLKESHDGHAHKETNAICLAAYGEMLLRGGGYNGWATPEQGFSWDYIHGRAISGNVVLFDYAVPQTEAEQRAPSPVNDHVKSCGSGITASLLPGIVDGGIDCARGESGDAIPNGRHERNFLFVHPSGDAGGYYVVIDALSASPGATGHVVWHPASPHHVESTEHQEYTWTTREFSGREASLTLLLATPPRDCVLRDGILANWGNGVIGKYLVGNYALGETGRRDVVTVLFPHDAKHAKADFARLAGDGFTGATVRQGATADDVFACDDAAPVSPAAGVTVTARAGVVRRTAGSAIASLWLMDAVAFDGFGIVFRSTLPVTLFWQADALHVAASVATRATFERPDGGRIEQALEPGTTVLVL